MFVQCSFVRSLGLLDMFFSIEEFMTNQLQPPGTDFLQLLYHRLGCRTFSTRERTTSI